MTKREQQEKLFRAIGFVGDDLISRADAPVEKHKPNLVWVKWAALAACCALVIGLASRLPLWSMKSANTTESAPMTMETSAAAAQDAAESPAAAEPEETTEEAAAEEAPAEADQKAGESGSRGEAATDGILDEALAQALLNTTLGPVKLGMPAEDVRSLLGAPKDEGDELYVCTDKGDFRYIRWNYNFTDDPNHFYDVSLDFADKGDGFVLNDIQTFGTSGWALPSGLKNGCSADDVLAVYPDAELEYSGESGDGSPMGAISLEAGHVRLIFLVEGETVTSISLGTYYEEPGWIEENYEEPAYSFASANITMYQKEDGGWRSRTFTGKDAKRIEVICGIELLEPIDTLPEPVYYLDFQNGTVVMLGENRISGAVYTCEDLDGFRAAMEKNEDPAPYLTLLEKAEFPHGTDDVIQELAAAE